MSNPQVETVKQYIQLRSQGKDAVPQIMGLLTAQPKITDAYGKDHVGSEAVRTYLTEPTPTQTPKGDPTILADGRILYEFTVQKFLLTWSMKAYFTMEGDRISYIKLEK